MARKEYLENNKVKQLATDLSAYEKQQPDKWSGGTYGKSVDAALQKILKRDKFQYDVNGDALYQQYKALADAEGKVLFGGRLGEYKYYDMDRVIESALARVRAELAK